MSRARAVASPPPARPQQLPPWLPKPQMPVISPCFSAIQQVVTSCHAPDPGRVLACCTFLAAAASARAVSSCVLRAAARSAAADSCRRESTPLTEASWTFFSAASLQCTTTVGCHAAHTNARLGCLHEQVIECILHIKALHLLCCSVCSRSSMCATSRCNFASCCEAFEARRSASAHRSSAARLACSPCCFAASTACNHGPSLNWLA